MSQMRVAEPTAPRVGADRVVNYLTETLKELDGCQSNLEIQKVASKVESVFTDTMGCGSDSASVVEAIKKAEASLKEDGQSVKASRMAKIGKLMVSLPKKSPKKQRKMLREILQLCGKNVGVNIGKRGLCGNSLFCNAAVITGSVLALAGATTVIALAAAGQFDDPTDNFAMEEQPQEAVEETPENPEEALLRYRALQRLKVQTRFFALVNELDEDDYTRDYLSIDEEALDILKEKVPDKNSITKNRGVRILKSAIRRFHDMREQSEAMLEGYSGTLDSGVEQDASYLKILDNIKANEQAAQITEAEETYARVQAILAKLEESGEDVRRQLEEQEYSRAILDKLAAAAAESVEQEDSREILDKLAAAAADELEENVRKVNTRTNRVAARFIGADRDLIRFDRDAFIAEFVSENEEEKLQMIQQLLK